MEVKSLYKLKESVQVKVTRLGNKTLTNHNITNDLSEAFLFDNPENRISLFLKFPRDWKTRVQSFGEVKEDVKEETVLEPVLEPKTILKVQKVSSVKKVSKKRANNKKK
tara:strand:+ start:68 stop:394 length:327 start_codon:yes stop_codon:yes gene_type:complete